MPFIETALIGDDEGENILHIGAVTYRVTGYGNLVQTFVGLDDILQQTLLPFPMSTVSGREKTRLANFKSQRSLLRLETTEINEYFDFSRIILQVKKHATGYPQ